MALVGNRPGCGHDRFRIDFPRQGDFFPEMRPDLLGDEGHDGMEQAGGWTTSTNTGDRPGIVFPLLIFRLVNIGLLRLHEPVAEFMPREVVHRVRRLVGPIPAYRLGHPIRHRPQAAENPAVFHLAPLDRRKGGNFDPAFDGPEEETGSVPELVGKIAADVEGVFAQEHIRPLRP